MEFLNNFHSFLWKSRNWELYTYIGKNDCNFKEEYNDIFVILN